MCETHISRPAYGTGRDGCVFYEEHLGAGAGPDLGPERGSAKGTMADFRLLVSTRLRPGGRAAVLPPL